MSAPTAAPKSDRPWPNQNDGIRACLAAWILRSVTDNFEYDLIVCSGDHHALDSTSVRGRCDNVSIAASSIRSASQCWSNVWTPARDKALQLLSPRPADDPYRQGWSSKLSEHRRPTVDHRAFFECVSSFKPQEHAQHHPLPDWVRWPDRLYAQSQEELGFNKDPNRNPKTNARYRSASPCFATALSGTDL